MSCGKENSLPPPEEMYPDHNIETEDEIIQKIKQSGKIFCFDESFLMSPKGLELAQKLRSSLGSNRFFYLQGIEEKLKEKKKNPAEAYQASQALNFLQSITISGVTPTDSLLMLTQDINLAEYLGKRSGESSVYFLHRNGSFRCWKDERNDNLKDTQEQLADVLADKKCWITSSALASARLTRFTEVVQQLPAPVRANVQILDASAQRAISRNLKVEKTVNKLSSLCCKHLLGAALPAAKEWELIALSLYYGAKDQCLLTVWNDTEEALRVWKMVEGMDKGKERLSHVAFCQFSWYGKLEALKGFSQLSGTETLLPGKPEQKTPELTRISPPTVNSIASYLKKETRELQTTLSLEFEDIIFTPTSTLKPEHIQFLVRDAYQDEFKAREPGEQDIRSAGAKLGKLISRVSIEEIRKIAGSDATRRELGIIYARRWGKAEVLQALLNDSEVLSPYCFNNWFKGSQNKEHNMTLEELMLNSTYYHLLIQVINKSAYLTKATDTIDKLQLLQRSAVISEVRKRAQDILKMAAEKGAASE